MFAGIVETTSSVAAVHPRDEVLEVRVARPAEFDDLHIGDSIAVNGVCLTVENFDAHAMSFALGPETLRVTGWNADTLKSRPVNLERSLRLSDRIHGHLVTGHVDAVTQVTARETQGESLKLTFALPAALKPFVWSKGSVALNGVSLTLNHVDAETFSVGLIPETLKRTNLGRLETGHVINVEIDNMARGLVNWVHLHEGKPR